MLSWTHSTTRTKLQQGEARGGEEIRMLIEERCKREGRCVASVTKWCALLVNPPTLGREGTAVAGDVRLCSGTGTRQIKYNFWTWSGQELANHSSGNSPRLVTARRRPWRNLGAGEAAWVHRLAQPRWSLLGSGTSQGNASAPFIIWSPGAQMTRSTRCADKQGTLTPWRAR
eukprot:gene22373-biopygen8752